MIFIRRTWMVTDNHHKFVTARQVPKIVTIQPTIQGDDFLLEAPGMDTLVIPKIPSHHHGHDVVTSVWVCSFYCLCIHVSTYRPTSTVTVLYICMVGSYLYNASMKCSISKISSSSLLECAKVKSFSCTHTLPNDFFFF